MQYKKPLPDEGDPRPTAEFDVAESGPVGRQTGPDGPWGSLGPRALIMSGNESGIPGVGSHTPPFTVVSTLAGFL